MKNIFTRWKKVAKLVGNIQATILLTLIYIFIVIPLGFLFRKITPQILLGQIEKSNKKSYWIKKMQLKNLSEWAKSQ